MKSKSKSSQMNKSKEEYMKNAPRLKRSDFEIGTRILLVCSERENSSKYAGEEANITYISRTYVQTDRRDPGNTQSKCGGLYFNVDGHRGDFVAPYKKVRVIMMSVPKSVLSRSNVRHRGQTISDPSGNNVGYLSRGYHSGSGRTIEMVNMAEREINSMKDFTSYRFNRVRSYLRIRERN